MAQPICQNDKTIQDIRSLRLFHDETFTLYLTFPGCICSIWASIWYVMGANTNGFPYNVQTNMPLGKVQFSSVILEFARKDAASTFGILKRGGAYWRVTCFFKPKKKMDSFGFTYAMSQHAHWAWQMTGRGHDVAADSRNTAWIIE